MFKVISPYFFFFVCCAFPPLFLVYLPALIALISKAIYTHRRRKYLLGVYHAHTAQVNHDKAVMAFGR
jgi:hypothetical protein